MVESVRNAAKTLETQVNAQETKAMRLPRQPWQVERLIFAAARPGVRQYL
jgi:hypothetical protein